MMFSSWAPNLCVEVLTEAPEATCLHPGTPTLPRLQSWGWYHCASREVACFLGKGYTWGDCTPPHPGASSCPCPTPSLVTCDSSCLGQGHRKPVWSLFLPCASGQGCPSLSAFSAEECPLPLFSISLENSPHRKNGLAECVCVWHVHRECNSEALCHL